MLVERVLRSAQVSGNGYINDIDFIDAFKECSFDVLTRLGPEAFYNNSYTRANFWKLVLSGHSYLMRSIKDSEISSLVTCAIELPLKPKMSDDQYLYHFCDDDLHLLDQMFAWPRFVFYKSNIKDFTEFNRDLYPVSLHGNTFVKHPFLAFNSIFKTEDNSFSLDDVIDVLRVNTDSDSIKISTLETELGYSSRLVLFPIEAHINVPITL